MVTPLPSPAAPPDARLRGVSPVLAVPFHPNGDLDTGGFVAVVEHVLSAGVSSALLFGLASEFHKLSDAERDRLAALLLERSAEHPEFAAILSVTDHATHPAVRRAQSYQERGAGVINILPPHFLAPPRRAVLDHLDAVMAAVDIPVIVQYAPAQTGTALAPHDLSQLAERHANFAIVKVESTPPGPMIAALADRGLASFVGQAGLHLPSAVSAGAIGVQPGCSMLPLYQEIWAAVDGGDDLALHAAYDSLLPTIVHWMTNVETIVQAEKTVLQRLGVIESDHCRAPGGQLDAYALGLVEGVVARISEMVDL